MHTDLLAGPTQQRAHSGLEADVAALKMGPQAAVQDMIPTHLPNILVVLLC